MAEQGSTGNVIAALCSVFLPGFGQLLQGRVLLALVHFVLAVVLHVITLGTLGWIMHVWSCISAARYHTPGYSRTGFPTRY